MFYQRHGMVMALWRDQTQDCAILGDSSGSYGSISWIHLYWIAGMWLQWIPNQFQNDTNAFWQYKTQQYEWLRELYPTVFERIKEKEKAGQWEIIGGVRIIDSRFVRMSLTYIYLRAGSNMASILAKRRFTIQQQWMVLMLFLDTNMPCGESLCRQMLLGYVYKHSHPWLAC